MGEVEKDVGEIGGEEEMGEAKRVLRERIMMGEF
jgi:hypothetical protein